MRILMDSHMVGQKQTGIERYWSNLIRALARQKDIEIFEYSNRNQPEDAQLSHKYIPLSNMGLYRILFGFQDAVHRFKPDLIHVSNFIPTFVNQPIITTVHDMCYSSKEANFSLKSKIAFMALLGRSLRLSHAVISVSQYTKKKIIEQFNISPDKIHVIYEAADPVFKPVKNYSTIRNHLKKIGIRTDYFLVVGNIEQRKRPYDIIRIFRKFLGNNLDFQLIFAGPNRLGDKFKRDNEDLIQKGSLVLLNYVDNSDLNLLYNGARSLIFFSSCEGFGLPLVEAMSCRIPIICSDIEVFREICGPSGLYADDSNSFLNAMCLMKKKSANSHYADLSQKRGMLFSWEKAAKETLELYTSYAKAE